MAESDCQARWVLGALCLFGCSASAPQRNQQPPSPALAPAVVVAPSATVSAPAAVPFPRKAPQANLPELSSKELTPLPEEPELKASKRAESVRFDCGQYSNYLVERRLREMRLSLRKMLETWRANQHCCYRACPARAAGATDSPATSGQATLLEPARIRSGSDSNNQVPAVDEGDSVKRDDRYVYLATADALHIASILPPRIVSVTPLRGQVKELLQFGDIIVVFSAIAQEEKRRCRSPFPDCDPIGDGSRTLVSVYEISERSQPKLVRDMELSGTRLATRRIGQTIHLVVAEPEPLGPALPLWPEGLPNCGVSDAAVRAGLKQLEIANERVIRNHRLEDSLPTLSERGHQAPLCASFIHAVEAERRVLTSVISFELSKLAEAPVAATIASDSGIVYASGRALYLAVTQPPAGSWRNGYEWKPDSDFSEIHKFNLGEHAGETRYAGSGHVSGRVINQLAMDDWHGYLRVATIRGAPKDRGRASSVSVLTEAANHRLVRIGMLGNLARGEDLRALRFDEDRAYLVTKRQSAPLLVLDLKRPQEPRLVGELTLPGFSTYFHRIDHEHLLSIGFDTAGAGQFEGASGVSLQLFDGANAGVPRLLHRERVGDRLSRSAAVTEHLAFNYFAPKGLLAIPVSYCKDALPPRIARNLTFGGTVVYQVGIEGGFEELGRVSHASRGIDCNEWWSNWNSAPRRSLFLDDWIWSIANDRIKVQRLTALGQDAADLKLE